LKTLQTKINNNKNTLIFAFEQSIPVLLGYLFLGMAFGLMIQKAGYHVIWAFFMSLFIYAGSMQFLLVALLTAGVDVLTCGIMTLLINGRHLFYGLSFVSKFKHLGKYYPYMVFSLTDETYSILCALKVPEGVNEKKAMFLIAIFDHSYWIMGSVLGTLAGQLIPFNSSGIEFSMTALFLVIFMNQWKEMKSHKAAFCGLACGILSLYLFGAEKFILPALFATVCLMVLYYIQNQKRGKEKNEHSI